jgi:release factor glutamine methyltransferase
LLDCLEVREGERILEVGCGSGILSIHCALAGGKVTAVDINPRAVECTLKNASRNAARLEARRSDLLSDVKGDFDLILFNPPYLPVKEKDDLGRAWSGGTGGMEVVERFLEQAPLQLAPGGRILLLVSSRMDQYLLRRVVDPFDRQDLSTRSFFFERLSVLMLRPVQGKGP